MIGRSQTSRIARTAARHSCRLIMVSTTNRSTPASASTPACSLYTSTSSSNINSPIGKSCCPVIVISPATKALPSTACFDSFTRVELISTRRSCRPYSSSLIRFPVNVGAYTICDPASTYSRCILRSTSGCSITHCSGQTPIGIPASIRFVPVAPSRMIGPFSFISLANSAFVIVSSLSRSCSICILPI